MDDPKSNHNIPDFDVTCWKIMETLGTVAFEKVQKVMYNEEVKLIKVLKSSERELAGEKFI